MGRNPPRPPPIGRGLGAICVWTHGEGPGEAMGEALIEHALEAPGDLERVLDAVTLRQGPLALSGLRQTH